MFTQFILSYGLMSPSYPQHTPLHVSLYHYLTHCLYLTRLTKNMNFSDWCSLEKSLLFCQVSVRETAQVQTDGQRLRTGSISSMSCRSNWAWSYDAQHKVKEPATWEKVREYKPQSSVTFLPQDTPEERLKQVDNKSSWQMSWFR